MEGRLWGMLLYLDDERPAPPGWRACRWPEEVIALIKTGGVEAISLDYYLGEGREYANPRTGMDVLIWLETWVGKEGNEAPRISVHSRDPENARKMGELAFHIYEMNRARRLNLPV